jgi:hypothetical protein
MNIDFKETSVAICDMISKMGLYIYIYIRWVYIYIYIYMTAENCSNVDCRLLMTFMKHDMEKHIKFI